MKRSRFTEEQIVAILREQEAGVATADLCRKHGVSSATFYKWRRRGGRKRAMRTRAPITLPLQPNQRWSLDFVNAHTSGFQDIAPPSAINCALWRPRDFSEATDAPLENNTLTDDQADRS